MIKIKGYLLTISLLVVLVSSETVDNRTTPHDGRPSTQKNPLPQEGSTIVRNEFTPSRSVSTSVSRPITPSPASVVSPLRQNGTPPPPASSTVVRPQTPQSSSPTPARQGGTPPSSTANLPGTPTSAQAMRTTPPPTSVTTTTLVPTPGNQESQSSSRSRRTTAPSTEGSKRSTPGTSPEISSSLSMTPTPSVSLTLSTFSMTPTTFLTPNFTAPPTSTLPVTPSASLSTSFPPETSSSMSSSSTSMSSSTTMSSTSLPSTPSSSPSASSTISTGSSGSSSPSSASSESSSSSTTASSSSASSSSQSTSSSSSGSSSSSSGSSSSSSGSSSSTTATSSSASSSTTTPTTTPSTSTSTTMSSSTTSTPVPSTSTPTPSPSTTTTTTTMVSTTTLPMGGGPLIHTQVQFCQDYRSLVPMDPITKSVYMKNLQQQIAKFWMTDSSRMQNFYLVEDNQGKILIQFDVIPGPGMPTDEMILKLKAAVANGQFSIKDMNGNTLECATCMAPMCPWTDYGECSDKKCMNGGICRVAATCIYFCECKNGWEGRYCDKMVGPVKQKENLWLLWLLILPLALLALLLLLCCLCCMHRQCCVAGAAPRQKVEIIEEDIYQDVPACGGGSVRSCRSACSRPSIYAVNPNPMCGANDAGSTYYSALGRPFAVAFSDNTFSAVGYASNDQGIYNSCGKKILPAASCCGDDEIEVIMNKPRRGSCCGSVYSEAGSGYHSAMGNRYAVAYNDRSFNTYSSMPRTCSIRHYN